MTTVNRYEVHYDNGEIYVTDYKESYKIFQDQYTGGRRCYIQPVVFPYKEP